MKTIDGSGVFRLIFTIDNNFTCIPSRAATKLSLVPENREPVADENVLSATAKGRSHLK